MNRNLLLLSLVGACAAASAQDLSGLAAGLLGHVEQARQSVTRREQSAALDHIRQAQAAADQILATAPPHPAPVEVPVYRDVETTTTYGNVKRVKNDEMTAARLKRNSSVREVEGQSVTAYLDVRSSSERLKLAESKIQAQDWIGADVALAAIPNSIIRKHVEGDIPLLKVIDNLELARARIVNEKYNDASAPLHAAADALAAYQKLSPGPHGDAALAMREEILEFVKHIPHNQDDALTKINLWSEPVKRWQDDVVKK